MSLNNALHEYKNHVIFWQQVRDLDTKKMRLSPCSFWKPFKNGLTKIIKKKNKVLVKLDDE